jgi:hypothetical protein
MSRPSCWLSSCWEVVAPMSVPAAPPSGLPCCQLQCLLPRPHLHVLLAMLVHHHVHPGSVLCRRRPMHV